MDAFLGTLILLIFAVYLVVKLLSRYLPQIIMWGIKRRMRSQARQQQGSAFDSFFGRGQASKDSRARAAKRRPRRKIIPKGMGEYVEFEEISVYQASETTTSAESTSRKYKDEPQVSDADWEDIK